MTIDRDQNIWLAGTNGLDAFRYTPDRTNQLKQLGSGFWTHLTNTGKNTGATGSGRGIGADSRSAKAYFVWMTTDTGIVQLPGSLLPVLKVDQDVDASNQPFIKLPGFLPRAVAVGTDQNLIAVSRIPSVVARIRVDKNGVATPPDLTSLPKGNNLCPAGDRCSLEDPQNKNNEPASEPYANFLPQRIGVFERPSGVWSYVISGCPAEGANGQATDTTWLDITWEAEVPPNTFIGARARAGASLVPDLGWGAWTQTSDASPTDLTGGALLPQSTMNGYLQVELTFKTQVKIVTPKLKCLSISYSCRPRL